MHGWRAETESTHFRYVGGHGKTTVESPSSLHGSMGIWPEASIPNLLRSTLDLWVLGVWPTLLRLEDATDELNGKELCRQVHLGLNRQPFRSSGQRLGSTL